MRDLRLALPGNGTAPAGSHQRVAYDLTAQAFGAGANGPLAHCGARPTGADTATRLAHRVAVPCRSSRMSPRWRRGQPAWPAPPGWSWSRPPAGRPPRPTADLVKRIRDSVGPLADAATSVAVTGTTAVGVDVSDKLSAALPEYLLVVIGLSFLLLLLAFRSILVPLKADARLSAHRSARPSGSWSPSSSGAGASSLFGVDRPGPLVSFLPIIMMGVLFGLAMDYEVFIVSRVREEFVHGADRDRGDHRRGRPRRPGGDRGRADHVGGVRRLRGHRRPDHQDDRLRALGRRADRRLRRPDDAGARPC